LLINDLDGDIVNHQAARFIDLLIRLKRDSSTAFTESGALSIWMLRGLYEKLYAKSKLDFSMPMPEACILKSYRSSVFYSIVSFGRCIRSNSPIWRTINLCTDRIIRSAEAVREIPMLRACGTSAIILKLSPQRLD
jgi:hypothetical protein